MSKKNTVYFIILLSFLSGKNLYSQQAKFNKDLLSKELNQELIYATKHKFPKTKRDTNEILIYSFDEGRTVPYMRKYINTEDSKTSAVYVCEGNGVVLSTPDFGEDATYAWEGPTGFKSNSQQIKLEKISPFKAGFYTFTIKTNSSTTKGKIKLMVKEKPRAIATGGVFCFGESAQLTSFDAGVGVSYKWTLPPTDFYETTPNVSVENLAVGKYTYYLSVTKNGCKSIDTANVIVKQIPIAMANNASIKVGDVAKLEAHDEGNEAKYIWKGPFLNTATINQKTINVSGLPNGKFVYILNVIKNGCTSMNVSVVEVGKENEAKASNKQ
jgi:hypothetical protein